LDVEGVADTERDLLLDVVLLGFLLRISDALRIKVDAYATLGVEFLDGMNHHAPVAAADVVDHVRLCHLTELAHAADDVVRRGHETNLDLLRVVRLAQVENDFALRLERDLA